MKYRRPILVAALLILSGNILRSQAFGDDTPSSKAVGQVPYRPMFHFTPAKNWMNDPNGTVFYHGEYHLFYQYNPFGMDWGHMSWGHAVSRDLIHWKDLPVALAEENGIMIFSGSAVVDWHNTSGLCQPHGKDNSCLIAIYTGHTEHLQTQNIAYSNDDGRTWAKYSGNPVIDLHLAGFRDPKVFWHDATKKWVMVTVLAGQHKVRLFGSADLKNWTALSDFGPAAAVGGAWECPDLFPLAVENEPGQTRWLLSINIFPGGLTGGSGNQYFIGEFDGTKFFSAQNETLWADYGRDFYASTSFSDIPKSDGRRIWLGWLSNWEYAPKAPTNPWRGTQSIPRELKLKRFDDGLRLVQAPVAELHTLRHQHTHLKKLDVEAANRLLQAKNVQGETLEILAEFDLGDAVEAGFKVRKGPGEETVIGFDGKQRQLFVDRTRSGEIKFAEKFAGRHAAPVSSTGRRVRFHIFVDRSSVEVFANDGEIVISELVFPSAASQGLELYSLGSHATIKNLEIWNLSISPSQVLH